MEHRLCSAIYFSRGCFMFHSLQPSFFSTPAASLGFWFPEKSRIPGFGMEMEGTPRILERSKKYHRGTWNNGAGLFFLRRIPARRASTCTPWRAWKPVWRRRMWRTSSEARRAAPRTRRTRRCFQTSSLVHSAKGC